MSEALGASRSFASSHTFKEGDWMCPNCDFHNFRSK